MNKSMCMTNIQIKHAEIEDIPIITNLAYQIWFKTYENIISKEQIDFMFGEMYTPDSLLKQMEFLKHQFLILSLDESPIAFASYGKLQEPEGTFKLHKLYLLPEFQGQGFGNILIEAVEKECSELGADQLHLNVNRNNKAFNFYIKLGYEIIETVDIPFAEFWLNDYVMAKDIKENN